MTQAENALVISLAAIPVYLLTRRLGLGSGLGLVAAALAVASPDLLFASFVMADPLAYPLVLTTIYAAVCALSRPSRRSQAAFVVLVALTTLTRIQYALLPIVFVAGAFAVERSSIRRTLWNFRFTWGLFAAPVVALVVVGPSRVLGYYNSVVSLHVRPASIVHWVATDSMLLVYCAGWVLIPGALIGFAYALGRPRSREEAAFGGVTAGLLLILFAETSMYALNGSPRFQERYFMGLLPLVLPWFGLYLKRGWPARLRPVSSRSCCSLSRPVSRSRRTASRTTKQDSPFLLGVDAFGNRRVNPADDGRFVSDGRTLRTPLLISNYAVRMRLSGAVLVARAKGYDLWRPAGTPRLALFVGGLYRDGWLAHAGMVELWPARGRRPGLRRQVVVLPITA